MAQNVVITDRMLADPLRVERYVYVTVKNAKQEQEFASKIESEMKQLISQRKVDARCYSETAKVGSANHPIVYVYNLNYGKIGLIINKNIVTAIMIEAGKTSQAINRKANLEEYSQHQLNRQMGTQTDGCCGCMEFLSHGHESSKAAKEAKQIEYDPLELAAEEAWKRDVLSCFDDVGKQN